MTKIFGIAIICWGVGLIYMVTEWKVLPIVDIFRNYDFGIFCFGIALVLIGIGLLFPIKNKVKFGIEIEYKPLGYAFKLLRRQFTFAFVGFALSFLFFLVALEDAIAYFGVAIAGLFLFSILWGIGNSFKKLRFDLKYGVTKLVSNQVMYHFGDTINFQIQNSNLPKVTYKYISRNISEGMEETNSGSETSVTHVFRTLYEEQKETNVLAGLSFKIPSKTTVLQTTNLDSKRVNYWEIEVENKEIYFFSRFVLNVQDRY